jgi:hypothetical protein
LGVKVVYIGGLGPIDQYLLGVREGEVEAISKAFLETVLEHGKTRNKQVDEDILEVHRQLLKNAPRIWGAPVLEEIE